MRQLFLVGMVGILLIGCGSKETSKDENSKATKYSKYFTPEVVDDKITLDKSAFGDGPVLLRVEL